MGASQRGYNERYTAFARWDWQVWSSHNAGKKPAGHQPRCAAFARTTITTTQTTTIDADHTLWAANTDSHFKALAAMLTAALQASRSVGPLYLVR